MIVLVVICHVSLELTFNCMTLLTKEEVIAILAHIAALEYLLRTTKTFKFSVDGSG